MCLLTRQDVVQVLIHKHVVLAALLNLCGLHSVWPSGGSIADSQKIQMVHPHSPCRVPIHSLHLTGGRAPLPLTLRLSVLLSSSRLSRNSASSRMSSSSSSACTQEGGGRGEGPCERGEQRGYLPCKCLMAVGAERPPHLFGCPLSDPVYVLGHVGVELVILIGKDELHSGRTQGVSEAYGASELPGTWPRSEITQGGGCQAASFQAAAASLTPTLTTQPDALP